MEISAMNVDKSTTRKFFLRSLSAYCRMVLGYGAKNGLSIYALGARALKVDGVARYGGFNQEDWCWQNYDHIVAKTKLVPTRKETKKQRRKPAPKAAFTQVEYTKTDHFLTSYEWRKLRMEALKKYGPKCMCCGATPATGAVMNVDHIKPRKLFPELALELSNLQILCHECNHGKGNWDQSDWRG